MAESFSLDHLYPRIVKLEDPHSSELSIYQSAVGDVGCVVWDAALALGKFMEMVSNLAKVMKDLVQGKGTVLELGAGTGFVGLVMAALGVHAVVSDLPEFLKLLEYNISSNKDVIDSSGGSCTAISLVWGSDDVNKLTKPNLIVLADCIYYEESLDSLVSTLKDLSTENTLVVCCHEERTTDNKPRIQKQFFQRVAEHFHMERVPRQFQHKLFSSDDIHIDIFRLKTAD